MQVFLWGALSMASLALGLVFLRFYRIGKDRLFLFFAVGFSFLMANWVLVGLTHPVREAAHFAYVIRLIAFVVIITGIVDKNRRAKRSNGS